MSEADRWLSEALSLLRSPDHVTALNFSKPLPRWVVALASDIANSSIDTLPALVQYYKLTTLCGFTCDDSSRPTTPLSPYDSLVRQGRSDLRMNQTGLPFIERVELYPQWAAQNAELADLEMCFPTYMVQNLHDMIRFERAPFVLHAQSSSSFAEQSSPRSLPRAWVVYLLDFWRDRFICVGRQVMAA